VWFRPLSDVTTSDYALNNHLTPFISMQNHYNLLYREEEREMMPTLNVCMLMCPSASPLVRRLSLMRCVLSLSV
jgi:aryl-alcohol dehydrogenase-like predicted oxidoreductase